VLNFELLISSTIANEKKERKKPMTLGHAMGEPPSATERKVEQAQCRADKQTSMQAN
jgi:hypothetical protein